RTGRCPRRGARAAIRSLPAVGGARLRQRWAARGSLAFNKHASLKKPVPVVGAVRDRLDADGGCQRDLWPFAGHIPLLMAIVTLAAEENRGTASAITGTGVHDPHALADCVV